MFKIYLPVHVRAVADIPTKIEGVAPRGYEKILVGEDDAAVRGATLRVLESAGYSVVAVENGAEACHAAARSRFDLVLLDVIMPEMSCRDALKGLKAELPNARYILSSGYTADLNVDELLKDGTIYSRSPTIPRSCCAWFDKCSTLNPRPRPESRRSRASQLQLDPLPWALASRGAQRWPGRRHADDD